MRAIICNSKRPRPSRVSCLTSYAQVSTEKIAAPPTSIGQKSFRDPGGKFAGLTAEEKARLTYRTDFGVYDSKNDEVGFDELPAVLTPGTLVVVDANLF